MEFKSAMRHYAWQLQDIVCRYKIIESLIQSHDFVHGMINDVAASIQIVGLSDKETLYKLLYDQMYYSAIMEFLEAGINEDGE